MVGKNERRQPEGQPEACTRYLCRQCGSEFDRKSRNGEPREFCSSKCRYRWHNAQRLKGAALLKMRKPAVPRRVNSGKRRVDLEVIPEAERPALLVEAARRLGLTEEGPMLKAARLAAQPSAFSLQPSEATA